MTATVRLGAGRHKVIQWSGLRIREAEGSWLQDEDGRRYLDFFGASGVNLLGHCHPRVARRVREAFGSRGIGAFPGIFEDDLVARLGVVLAGGKWCAELFSGGAEAVEAALRAAEEYTGRRGVLAFDGGFHGKTMGARSVTQGAKPPVIGAVFARYPDRAKCPHHAPARGLPCSCVTEAGEVVAASAEHLGAIIVEPVQGRSGNITPPPGFLTYLRRLADEYGLLLIVDETLTGLGRTGAWLAHHEEDVRADLIVIGKGLGGGYPVSALIGEAGVMDAGSFGVPSGSSSSFGGYAAAAAAAAATLVVLEEQDLIIRSRAVGAGLLADLETGLAGCPAVTGVSGRGLCAGIHFADPSADTVRMFFDECFQQGLITMTGEGCARLYPPLTISPDDVRLGTEILCAAAWRIAKGTGR
ncbi:aspartate aminotransferase family protein [Amycolatopsis sp. NPDC026612]|uniref:aspartate aminotransferase family protein n=1 Tax=Amycolatopsis sp. NPDC026612 TaxID=3155466 RepID=UPI0033D30F76